MYIERIVHFVCMPVYLVCLHFHFIGALLTGLTVFSKTRAGCKWKIYKRQVCRVRCVCIISTNTCDLICICDVCVCACVWSDEFVFNEYAHWAYMRVAEVWWSEPILFTHIYIYMWMCRVFKVSSIRIFKCVFYSVDIKGNFSSQSKSSAMWIL